jgi:methionyl aminopeptidase
MIPIKTQREIEIMREGGKILAGIMEELEKKVRPGIKTLELGRLAESLILNSGASPSFKGYTNRKDGIVDPYPSSLCTSINEEIVHCLPSERVLKEGDIISLDLGIYYKGFHTDMATTVPVGKVAPESQRLIKVTKKALKRGINEIKPGNHIGDIENAIQKFVEENGFNVVRDLCGHGIGKELHEDPQILNFGKKGSGTEIKEGMVLCLEPMVAIGDSTIKRAKDGWGYSTFDDSLSAHFEHTIAVAKKGAEILTEFPNCDKRAAGD